MPVFGVFVYHVSNVSAAAGQASRETFREAGRGGQQGRRRHCVQVRPWHRAGGAGAARLHRAPQVRRLIFFHCVAASSGLGDCRAQQPPSADRVKVEHRLVERSDACCNPGSGSCRRCSNPEGTAPSSAMPCLHRASASALWVAHFVGGANMHSPTLLIANWPQFVPQHNGQRAARLRPQRAARDAASAGPLPPRGRGL